MSKVNNNNNDDDIDNNNRDCSSTERNVSMDLVNNTINELLLEKDIIPIEHDGTDDSQNSSIESRFYGCDNVCEHNINYKLICTEKKKRRKKMLERNGKGYSMRVFAGTDA